MGCTMPAPPKNRLRTSLLILLWLGLSALAGWGSYHVARDYALDSLQVDGNHRLDLYTASLQREIDKYAFLPGVMALQPQVQSLLQVPDDAGLTLYVNRYLEALSQSAGTLSVYLLDHSGRVLAASNWQRADSFVGEDLSFRPYVQQALRQGYGRYFGIGTTRGEPGYYLTTPLGQGEQRGIAVVKVGLSLLEHSWAAAESPVFVSDENTVLMLSNVPQWRFTTLDVLDDAQRARLKSSLKYNQQALQPLNWKILDSSLQGNSAVQLVELPGGVDASSGYSSGQFLALSRTLAGSPWKMTVLLPLASALPLAQSRAWLTAVMVALGLMLLALLLQRRSHLREQLAARQALQQAHDALERQVQQRTAQLQSANTALQQEVAERMQAEVTLRAAQDELVQAGKLAVIGKLSTEVAHELNQPLAALRALAGNSQRFLERSQTDMVQSNLQRMADLSDRMGRITGQLRNVARRSLDMPQAVPLADVMEPALALMQPRMDRCGAEVVCDIPAQLRVLCDTNRVQQVLINLLGNALDAMLQHSTPRIEICGEVKDGQAHISVRDHGPGLSEQALAHLFQPFFTTKLKGEGLGLGLSLSSDIAKASGGCLQGRNHPEGGAVFTLSLPLADTQPLL